MTRQPTSIDRLLLLHQIGTVMQGTRNLRQLFHVILSACTAGEGLGYNRAFLFLLEPEHNQLRGCMAVGPESYEECARVWGDLGSNTMTAQEFIDSLDHVADFEQTELSRRVREIVVPLDAAQGLLARAAVELKPMLVNNGAREGEVQTSVRALLDLSQFAAVPLAARREIEGLLLVDNKFNQRPISEDDLMLLGVMGNQAGASIRNARLYERIELFNAELEQRVNDATSHLQRRLQQLSMLHEIELAILSHREPADILYQVVEHALELVDAACGAIIFVEDEDKDLQVRAVRQRDDGPDVNEMLKVGEWVALEVLKTGVARLVDQNDVLGRRLFCSILATPLVFKGQTIGAIHLARPAPSSFNETDREIMDMLAGEAMLVLHNARMFEDVERRYREVASLSEVQQAIVSSFDLDELLQLVVRKSVEVVPGTVACVIRLRNNENGDSTPAASYIFPGVDLTREELTEIESALDEPQAENNLQTAQLHGYTLICVPLRTQDDVIGMMHVYWRSSADNAREHTTILGFAGQAATAIQNVRLYHNLVQSYQELKEIQATLRQKEKLAVLGEMAATVAHEIRNPLTAIRGYAQRIIRMVEDGLKPGATERMIRYAGVVVSEVDRLNNVVSDVLSFSRRGSAVMGKVNINDLVQEVLRLEEIATQTGDLLISPDLAHDLPLVTCNGNQIKQVLVNLVQNGIQSMKGQGVLSVETAKEGESVNIYIADTGPGIPSELMDKVFQPFFSTKDNGTGLGLSLAKRVVEEDHRGSLTVTNRDQGGATFTISLPIQHGERGQPWETKKA